MVYAGLDGRTTTWRRELVDAMDDAGDAGPIVAVTPSEDVLDIEFDGGWGGSQGPAILVWTESYVYFPATYDGFEWMVSAPRNPTSEVRYHVGGE